MPSLLRRPLVVAFLAAAAALPAAAGELYLLAGVPGVGLGWAQPLNPNLGLRVDYVTLGDRSERRAEEGIDYDAKLKTHRAGVYADWFPFAGSFRVTLGLTSNQYQLDLDASGAGRTINVGGTNYTLGAADGYTAQVKFPSTTPYVGIGWGHQAAGPGLRFGFDLGASVGKAKLSAVGRGQLGTPQAQADIERELAELRDGVGKLKAVPQLSVSFGWSF